jgi:hypothetical protein
MKMISDSGPAWTADLNAVWVSEKVPAPTVPSTGIYAGKGKAKPINWLPAIRPNISDRVGNTMTPTGPAEDNTHENRIYLLQYEIATKGKNGSKEELDQTIIFSDERTGMVRQADGTGSLVVRESGFHLTIKAEQVGKRFYIRGTRTPVAVNGAEKGETSDSGEKSVEVKN